MWIFNWVLLPQVMLIFCLDVRWGKWKTIKWQGCGHVAISQFSVSVQSLNHVWIFVTSWTAGHQASLSIRNSQNLLKLMSIASVMPSNHLILCHSFLLPSSILPINRVFSNESVFHSRWPKYCSFSFSISSSSEYSGLI